jgi:hypothetical protein
VLGLIRVPLKLALAVAEGALDASLGALRLVRGLVEEDAADARFSVAEPPPRTPAKPAAKPPGPARPPAAAAPPPGAAPADDHVSEEPVPVAEFAEPGAEDGAGAEIEIAEPWDGYSHQDARTIVRELAGAGREALAAVELYEGTHKRRRSVSEAAGRRLKELSGPTAAKNR